MARGLDPSDVAVVIFLVFIGAMLAALVVWTWSMVL